MLYHRLKLFETNACLPTRMGLALLLILFVLSRGILDSLKGIFLRGVTPNVLKDRVSTGHILGILEELQLCGLSV